MINRDRLYGRYFTPQPNDIRYRIRGIVDHNERDFCHYYAGRIPIDKTTLRDLLIAKVPLLDFDANGLVKNKTGGLISLKYDFVHHKQELEGDNLVENIELRIMNKDSVIIRKKIECDQDYFNNLINSKQEDKRQMEFVELAREILG